MKRTTNRHGANRLRAALLSLLTILGIAIAATGCSAAPVPQWHPVTTEESQLLAISRFQNFDAGAREFSAEITVQGQQLALHGWYDYTTHIGYAEVTGTDFEPQALLWSSSSVAIRTQPVAALGLPELPVPAPELEAWSVRSLDPSGSNLDALLLSITLLGTDRPDNPLLLQQTGALWLSEEATDSGKLQVFAGPPSDEPLGPDDTAPTPETATVRYAIDDTGLMHRVELSLGERWVNVAFSTDAAPDLSSLSSLTESLFAEEGH